MYFVCFGFEITCCLFGYCLCVLLFVSVFDLCFDFVIWLIVLYFGISYFLILFYYLILDLF